jgi:hypothetical protein
MSTGANSARLNKKCNVTRLMKIRRAEPASAGFTAVACHHLQVVVIDCKDFLRPGLSADFPNWHQGFSP